MCLVGRLTLLTSLHFDKITNKNTGQLAPFFMAHGVVRLLPSPLCCVLSDLSGRRETYLFMCPFSVFQVDLG